MTRYRIAALLVVGAGLAVVASLKVTAAGEPSAPATIAAGEGTCCGPLPSEVVPASEAPALPTGSGRPCLAVFGSGKCGQCAAVDQLLLELAPRLEGVVDVVHLDPDVHPGPARAWSIRTIPTQILIDAEGREVVRHEGFVPRGELLQSLVAAGLKVEVR